LTTGCLGVQLKYKHKIERGDVGGLNSNDVLRRVLEKELGDDAGVILEENICVGIVKPHKKQLFEEFGGYTFVEFPESSICGHGLTAVLRPRTQYEQSASTNDSVIA